MARLIAVANLKGGAGKTTLAVSIAGELIGRGQATVLVDADPQQSATMWAQQGGDRFPVSVVTHATGSGKTGPAKFRAAIEQAQAEAGRRGAVIIDCPPELADATLLACLLADLVLIPTTPSPLDLWAAQKAVETVHEARLTRGRSKPKAILVPTRVATGTVMGRDVVTALEQFGEPVGPIVTSRIAHAEAAVAGVPIALYDPRSPARQDIARLVDFIEEV